LVFGFGKKIMDGCKNRSAVYKTYFSISRPVVYPGLKEQSEFRLLCSK
jgi:hypothetical protein